MKMYYANNKEFNVYSGFLASAKWRVSVVYHCLQYGEDTGPKGRSATCLTETELKMKFILFTRNPRQLTRLELPVHREIGISLCAEKPHPAGEAALEVWTSPLPCGLGRTHPLCLRPEKTQSLEEAFPVPYPLTERTQTHSLPCLIPYASLSGEKKSLKKFYFATENNNNIVIVNL